MKQLYAVLSLMLACAASLNAVTGYSATVLWRYTANGNPPVPEMSLPDIGGNEQTPVGQLARISIVNNAVTRTDTIIKMTTAFCQYPSFSVDGSKIAFFRWPYRVENGVTSADAKKGCYASHARRWA